MRRVWLSVCLASVAILFFSLAFLPVSYQHDLEMRVSCLANMKCISLAVLMYAQDHGQLLPPKPKAGLIKDIIDFHYSTKNEGEWHCPKQEKTFISYALAEAMLGTSLKKLNDPSQTVGWFECKGDSGRDWGAISADLEVRHRGFANYGYLDGHVNSLRAP